MIPYYNITDFFDKQDNKTTVLFIQNDKLVNQENLWRLRSKTEHQQQTNYVSNVSLSTI